MNIINKLDISNKTVLIRCDFNVPKDKFGNILDDRRIKATLPTINYCLERGCKVVLISHLGRPKAGVFDEKFSLDVVAKRVNALLELKNNFYFDDSKEGAVITKRAKELFGKLQSGDVLLLENLRFDARETENSKEFAKELSSFGEIYINDAFSVCHRTHASVVAITQFYSKDKKGAGFLLAREYHFFTKVLQEPKHPYVAVIGGSKISTKLNVLKGLLDRVDKLVIGGGMAYTFFKALGYEVGNSIVEDDLIDSAKEIMNEAKNKGVKLYLPVDVTVAKKLSEHTKITYVPYQDIPKNKMGLDIGPATIRLFKEIFRDAKTIFWNGPMGVYEIERFAKGSYKVSNYIAKSHALSVVGGGDSADVVKKAGDLNKMSFVSTGGGASLKLVAGEKLAGIEALE